MNSIAEIKRRIKRILDIERRITEKERDKYEEKKRDEESYWGCGGNYRRYEKCVEAREHHLEELDILEKQSGHGLVHTETLRLYPWTCPTCMMTIYLTDVKCQYGGGGDVVECPVCNRILYRSGHYTTWEVVKDSKKTELNKW